MKRRADTPRTRGDFHEAEGVLMVVRDPPPPPLPVRGQPPAVPGNPAEGVEILVAIWDDGTVTALNGHVDLGTGIRTALAQIVAEELDLPIECVSMVLGDTSRAPNQGATIASASIQIHSVPLRLAAAQARARLLEQASEVLGAPVASLAVKAGIVHVAADPGRAIGYGDLVRGRHVELMLSHETRLKPREEYRIVGQSVPRVDIPAKATGELVFVHDMRVPGMLHGRVVRPPYAGADHGHFIGNSLESVDESSIAHIPGIVAVVVIRDFVGIVAEREEHAEQAMRALKVSWKPWPRLPALDDLGQAIRDNPATRRVVADQGDVDAALAQAAVPMKRSYVWPYQMHASIGPSCALAHWLGESLKVWAGTQYPHALRADLGKLLSIPDTAIEVIRMEASGCYGRNCADDVAADAALLSRAVGRPVRVQLSREQEHLWEPKGAAQLMEVSGGLNADGTVAAYDFCTAYPSNGSVTLALLLTGVVDPEPIAYEMGDRTSVPPYVYENLRVTIRDMAPILRASWLRGVSALPNSFAHESYVDELASAAGVDPVEFRLRLLDDPRAVELVKATAERAGWVPHTAAGQQPPEGDIRKGQGFAYARYIHSRFPGFGAAWAAWVADVEVNQVTGAVHVSRVVVGHDAGLLVNPAGVQHQIHGNVVQTTSRALKEEVRVDPVTSTVASREWGSYPILSFREVPVIEVMLMPRPDQPPQGVGESASVPGTAAIANAIYDAIGVRLREPPFTPERVRAALGHQQSSQSPGATARPSGRQAGEGTARDIAQPPRRRKGLWATAVGLAAAAAGIAGAAIGSKPSIAPVRASASIYTAEVLERGRQLAAAGDCVVCHTAPGGVSNAGGRAMETPFGIVYSTNLTPDPETGIGDWSFSAFQRAMREGISRDGRHLYPVFPYPSFTRMTDDDLTAVYAWLMTQPPVRSEVPETRLGFPFGMRPLLAAWNALYLDPGPAEADTSRSSEWNRGEYLVNAVGHCSACHTPRNALGAERRGDAWLGGAMVDGWEAPPLGALTQAPVRWTEGELYRYLRTGYADQHGIAAGPMAPVIQQLSALPDEDIRAMAAYLASFGATGDREAAGAGQAVVQDAGGEPVSVEPAGMGLASAEPSALMAAQVVARAREQSGTLTGPSQRLFESACGACHHDGEGPVLLGRNIPLALSTKLHSERPDNLARVVLEGIREPASPEIGYMPAFADSLDDRQLAGLLEYMRQRFAPGRPAWTGLEASVARLRASADH
jgi:nicotinate dehydrogenase subunit B